MASNNKVFVVQSRINWDTGESETCCAVVGVADNYERAKEMLKEEVEQFFVNYNERLVSGDPDDIWGAERELSTDNEEDFPNKEYYLMDDYDLDVFCEVNILEKVINA